MNNLENVYVSTGAFQTNNLTEILEVASTAGLHFIELSSGVEYDTNNFEHLQNIFNKDNCHFLIHNYFPTPKESFVINLASEDKNILRRSREHCKNALKLTAELGAPFYSVHCGFCFHANPVHLGRNLTSLERFSKEGAHRVFVESLRLLADYAAQHNLYLLIENNVLTEFNLVEGDNALLLGITADDLSGIFAEVNMGNLGLLLDVGHLKVSAQTLQFSPDRFIEELNSHIRAIHLSDNDGWRDSNQKVQDNSWFWEPLSRLDEDEIVWILEVYDIPLLTIKSQLAVVEEKIKSIMRSKQ
jgi:sugar phosphate isomerase/epimerase